MKREFLQNLTVEGKPLSKEVIDAIMAENGRDIERTRAGFSDYESLQQQVLQLQEQEKQSKQTFEKQLDSVRFESLVRSAVENARGRNIKAISALLDLQTLQESENRQDAVKQAVEQLKKEASYLFDEETPPPYAWGTGAKDQHDHNAPDTLAGALKEKFERK